MPNKFKKRRKIYKMEIDETDDSGVFAISLVSEPAIEETFLYLSKNFQMVQLAEADKDKRMLIGPVLIPNKEIPRIDEESGEEYSIVFTPDVVEKAAQMFLKNQKNNNATLEHMKDIQDISVVESWIIADPEHDKSVVYGMKYPKGTWMIMMKINNQNVWNEFIKTGKVKGFSLEGLFGHNLIENGGYGYGWGVPDVQSSDSPQTYPETFPHGIANRPNNVPYNTTQLSQVNQDNDEAYAQEIISEVKSLLLGEKVELQSYSDYPEAVKNNAKKGIELNDKIGNRCATQVGKVRAQQLAQGESLSLETIKRMYSYLSRAGEFYDESDTSACGTISYLLWGGLAGLRWSKSKLRQLGELEELETSVSIASSYAGQFGEPNKKPRVHKGVKKYIAESLQLMPGNINVLGYETKNFDICPTAVALFTHLVAMDKSLGINAENQGMIRSAAQIADNVFGIEKIVIEKMNATDQDILAANILVDDFMDLMHEIDEELGMIHDTDFMYDHIDKIQSYYAA